MFAINSLIEIFFGKSFLSIGIKTSGKASINRNLFFITYSYPVKYKTHQRKENNT